MTAQHLLDLAWVIPVIPAFGAVVLLLFGKRIGEPKAGWLATALMALAFVASVILFFALRSLPADQRSHVSDGYTWIQAGGFRVDFRMLADPLSSTMILFVTGVGALIHLYAIGYMHGDERFSRFFAYLNLFAASMLVLVLGSSFLVTFMGWEGVGLCSYLLISFWFERNAAAVAGKKAFVTNRVGDFGFMIAMFLIFSKLGSLDYSVANSAGGHLSQSTVTAIALLLFLGAIGKSAQIPLHVWLPDAMEGPTPVSALIHAATMVTAGVFLVVRAHVFFDASNHAGTVVAWVGAVTALFAATVAIVQNDIKRVLAYSTLSQLGYMFAALGVGAFTAAIFHLMAHGFFKGLLFLGSGSVIHAVHEEQDMRRMGGLARKIPITYATMLVGSLAIAGIPPLAGFFSKDEILGEAFKLGFPWVWAIGVVVALMTAFYMFRLMGLTFWGESRVDPHVEPNIHESPPVMTWPLILLAIPSALVGLILGLPFGAGLLASWLEPIFKPSTEALHHVEGQFQLFGIDGALIGVSVAVAAAGIAVAWRLFGAEIGRIRLPPRPAAVSSISARVPFLYRASLNKWWFDDLYHLLFIVIGGRIAAFLWWFDRRVVDDTVNDLAKSTVGAGRGLRRVQTGRVQNYALGIALGLLVMAGSFLILAGRV